MVFAWKLPCFFIGNLAGALATGVWSATSMLLTPMLGWHAPSLQFVDGHSLTTRPCSLFPKTSYCQKVCLQKMTFDRVSVSGLRWKLQVPKRVWPGGPPCFHPCWISQAPALWISASLSSIWLSTLRTLDVQHLGLWFLGERKILPISKEW